MPTPVIGAEKTFDKSNLKILDTFRGFAALYVLAGHARWLLWEGYNAGYKLHPTSYNIVDKVLMYFFSIFQFGNQAVLFFFILSGFVIHWSTSNRVYKVGKLEVWDYLCRRCKRIYPPLLMAIILTYVVDKIGLTHHLPVYFSHTLYPSINENIHPVLNLKTLLGNLTFLQTVYTPVWGTDGPMWSLMYEWWFYLLYIPIFWLFRKNKVLTTSVVLIAGSISAIYPFKPLLISLVLTNFITWYMGMLLADVLMDKKRDVKTAIINLTLILLTTILIYKSVGSSILLAVSIVYLLYISLTTNIAAFMKNYHKLAEFSYTLYIVHVPIICLISGYIMTKNNQHLPMHSYFIVCGIIFCIAIAWLLHLVCERPFVKK
ncbi:MAG TPA: acyltransferase [Bacteroidia bacterium]|jgi:peptidoglycan/LPS O-acetylase OafA/YrhL|nr:acyltransferase [Bacteroidia bacterium]